MAVKPGYLTTEFWVSVFSALMGFLVLSGVVPGLDHASGDALVDAVAAIVEAVVSIVAIVGPLLGYIRSRTDVKAAAALAEADAQQRVG